MTGDAAERLFPGAVRYRPGDGPALNAEILGLMRAGRKTATCAALSEFSEAEPAPEPGRVDIALDWAGQPALATRTLAVEQLRWDEMDEARVPPQGEFRDLADWRAGYRAYLTRAGRFREDLPLIYETFAVVHDFGEEAA
ncbi:ASCH domain-containing protein [Litorisediminicola beolgyonensis]|uniref:ASCH domain-containing protein n=1 Tax=Litorisediminicola beolgyonensis TaxID=1173614 RepID=A0ABW3ZIY8_9RHOB